MSEGDPTQIWLQDFGYDTELGGAGGNALPHALGRTVWGTPSPLRQSKLRPLEITRQGPPAYLGGGRIPADFYSDGEQVNGEGSKGRDQGTT